MLKLNADQTIKTVENQFLKTDLPVIRIGDNVKIGVKIIEGNKERVQSYEGTVIAKKKQFYQYNYYCSQSSSRYRY